MPPEEKPEEPTVDNTEDGGMKIEELAGIEPETEEPEAQEPEVAKEPEAQEPITEPVTLPEPELPAPPAEESPSPPLPEPSVQDKPAIPDSEYLINEDKKTNTPNLVTPTQPLVVATPPVVDTPPRAPVAEPTLPIAPTPPIAPILHDPKYTKDIPQKILELTPDEINAARLLWARENIASAREQSYKNRREHMNQMNAGVEAIVKANPQTTTRDIALEMSISEKSASGYLYRLVKAGRIKSSGNSHNKRYFV